MKKSLFILLISGWLVACSDSKPAQTGSAGINNPGAEAKPDTLQALVLSSGPVEKAMNLPGELLPFERVQLRAKVPGFIRRIAVDIGSPVRAGQVLAVLDAPEQKARLAEARSRMQVSQAKLVASQDVYRRLSRAAQTPGVVAESELARVHGQVVADSAENVASRYAANALRDIDSYLVLRAPFDGVITKRNADVGTYVGTATDQPILEIENNRTLRLRVAVPEALTGGKLKDNKISFTTKAVPNQKQQAVLVRKSESIDVGTRSEIWEFRVDNTAHQLKSGMFADVTLKLSRSKPSVVVPFSTVVTTLERKFVIRIVAGQTQWVDVRPGLNVPDGVEIFGEIQSGDTLVLKGNEEIKPDTKVVATVEKPKKP
ncbi:efflux RND transporter periplasmic adaptor subunit [Fibrella aquatica]|uniref:efflux RND transporter periplasmic adaptor subunit n=1 Tax=Fibrella aquatica TaxID=3242487 RepID=UPI00351F8660